MQGQGKEHSEYNDYNNEPDSRSQESNNQLADALATYFEHKNSGEKIDTVAFVQAYPNIKLELSQALNILQLPEQVAPSQPDVKEAWQRFKTEVFNGQTAKATQTAPDSLGSYVAQALVQNDVELKNSGLARPTLVAMSQDATPLSEFQNYKFDDYAQLAKRYGVKNELFPRVLKWFKGLSKSLGAGPKTSFGRAGAMFAREEGFQRDISEAQLTQALEQAQNKAIKAPDSEDNN